jgi:hypothetical protein
MVIPMHGHLPCRSRSDAATAHLVMRVIPQQEGQQAFEISGSATDPNKKGKGSKPSQEPQVRINAEWIIEHASQVAPLVPGGDSLSDFSCPASSLRFDRA